MSNLFNIYPLKFKPILKNNIWGGHNLSKVLGKKDLQQKIGESWELSEVENSISTVENGYLKGKTLTSLITSFKTLLIGETVYHKFNGKFPLLFKYIDAHDDLSVQLHPNDQIAQKRHNGFGKTEMWYVLDAEPNALIYAGFNEKYNKEDIVQSLETGCIIEKIRAEEVKKGDVFFIEAGTIHAIGKGVLLAEIQQSSDITYRLYDWGRVDNLGKSRILHIKQGLEAIDLTKNKSCKIDYINLNNHVINMVACNYFMTNKYNLTKPLTKDLSQIDSFVVYMCVGGICQIEINNHREKISVGETVLIPAIAKNVQITPENNTEILEIYIEC